MGPSMSCRRDNSHSGSLKVHTCTVMDINLIHVREGRINGILEVSRSLGDLPYKKGTGKTVYPLLCEISFTYWAIHFLAVGQV